MLTCRLRVLHTYNTDLRNGRRKRNLLMRILFKMGPHLASQSLLIEVPKKSELAFLEIG